MNRAVTAYRWMVEVVLKEHAEILMQGSGGIDRQRES